jgi:hypothetical protein
MPKFIYYFLIINNKIDYYVLIIKLIIIIYSIVEMTYPKLPSNFDPFLPIINYYRNVQNINCLATLQEQFLFYVFDRHVGGSIGVARLHWLASKPLYNNRILDLCFKNLYISADWNRYHKDISFNNEEDRLLALSTIEPKNIEFYLKDIYADNCKLVELSYDIKYINVNCNGIIIRLDSRMLLKYSKMYNNTYKDYIYDEIKLNMDIDENTAKCVEEFINNKNEKALMNATNILAYHSVVDYLDINIKIKNNKYY